MTSRAQLVARAALIAALVVGNGCRRDRHPAMPAECQEIFERLVTLEMGEQGFRDSAALGRTQDRLQRELGPSIRACEGRRLSVDWLTFFGDRTAISWIPSGSSGTSPPGRRTSPSRR